MVFLNGLMVKNIEEIGKMENNMEKANILIQLIIFGEWAYGIMVKEYNGYRNNQKIIFSITIIHYFFLF